MAELIIENIASFFDPIRVVLEGKEYFARPMNYEKTNILIGFDKKLAEDPSAQYDRLEWILEAKPGSLRHLDPRLVGHLSLFLTKELFKATRKKVNEPGKAGSKK